MRLAPTGYVYSYVFGADQNCSFLLERRREAWKQSFKYLQTARQKAVNVVALRDGWARFAIDCDVSPFDNGDAVETIAQHAGCEQAGDAAAENNCVMPGACGHLVSSPLGRGVSISLRGGNCHVLVLWCYSRRMSQFLWIVVGALLLYLALRVVQLKRASLPFVAAYPLFVAVFFGGSVAVFLGVSWVSVWLGLAHEVSLVGVFGATSIGAVLLWIAARRMIG